MNSQLDEFLQCDELDELKEHIELIKKIDIQDVKEIEYILQNEVDIQATANILMNLNIFIHPDLELPFYITNGLESENEYIVLAAVIGSQNLSKTDISESDKHTIADFLLNLLYHERSTIRQRASVSLAGYPLLGQSIEDLILTFKINDLTVKHNLLVLLIDAQGLNRAQQVLNNLLTERSFSEVDQKFWSDQLSEIEYLLRDDPIDPIKVLMSSVGSTQLTYIPNFKEW